MRPTPTAYALLTALTLFLAACGGAVDASASGNAAASEGTTAVVSAAKPVELVRGALGYCVAQYGTALTGVSLVPHVTLIVNDMAVGLPTTFTNGKYVFSLPMSLLSLGPNNVTVHPDGDPSKANSYTVITTASLADCFNAPAVTLVSKNRATNVITRTDIQPSGDMRFGLPVYSIPQADCVSNTNVLQKLEVQAHIDGQPLYATLEVGNRNSRAESSFGTAPYTTWVSFFTVVAAMPMVQGDGTWLGSLSATTDMMFAAKAANTVGFRINVRCE